MNILLTSLQVPGAASGVRVHYERLATLLRAEGHQVTVVTQASLRPWVRRALGVMRRGLGLLGRLGQRVGLELTQLAEIYLAIDRRQRYDVVNAQDVGSGWAARLALRDQVPVVVTGHYNDHPGEEVVQQLGWRPDSLAARFQVAWFNLLLRRTRHFLSISHYALRHSRALLPARTRTAVVHNGVDMAAFAPPAPGTALLGPAPDLRALFPGRPIVLNIGQLEARKNQRYLVAVAAELRQRLPGCVTVLVGKGEDEALLRSLITEQHLQDDVVLLGYHTQVAPLLHAADVYVHTAARENCPYAVIEAIAAHCPVLALAAGGSPELLADTPEASIAQGTAPAVLAEQLAALLADADARRALQQRQHAYAQGRFDTAAMAAGTLAFYRQAMGLPSTPATAPQPAAPAALLLV